MDALATARQRLRDAHTALAEARSAAAATKDALDRVQGILRDREGERGALLATERQEAEAGATSLVDRIKAGLGAPRPEPSQDAVTARTKRAEVEHHVAEAALALAALDGEHVTAVEERTRTEKEHAAAVDALLKIHGVQAADQIVADATRLKFTILDFQASGLPMNDHPHLFTIGDLGGMLAALRTERSAGLPGMDWRGYRDRLVADPEADPIPA